MSKNAFHCGHCGAPISIRTSTEQSAIYRVMYLNCTNVLCGTSYRGTMEITHQYNIPAEPNPNFNLPQPPRSMYLEDKRFFSKQKSDQFDLLEQAEM
jgi:hypothetical protein